MQYNNSHYYLMEDFGHTANELKKFSSSEDLLIYKIIDLVF